MSTGASFLDSPTSKPAKPQKAANINQKKSINAIYDGLAMMLGVFIAGELFGDDMMRNTNAFRGAKADTRTVIHSKERDKTVLTLLNDFKAPDAPNTGT